MNASDVWNAVGAWYGALNWWQAGLFAAAILFVPVFVKAYLHRIRDPYSDFYYEVRFFTGMSALSSVLPVMLAVWLPYGWVLIPLLVGGSIVSGLGAYRRQHSRLIATTTGDYFRKTTRSLDLAVGQSDVYLTLYASTCLGWIHWLPHCASYWTLPASQIPVWVGLWYAHLAQIDIPPRRRDEPASTSQPSRSEIFNYIAGNALSWFCLMFFATIGSIGLLAFGSSRSPWLNALPICAIVIMLFFVRLPRLATRRLLRKMRGAARKQDLKALLKFARTKKFQEPAVAYIRQCLSKNRDPDQLSLPEWMQMQRLPNDVEDIAKDCIRGIISKDPSQLTVMLEAIKHLHRDDYVAKCTFRFIGSVSATESLDEWCDILRDETLPTDFAASILYELSQHVTPERNDVIVVLFHRLSKANINNRHLELTLQWAFESIVRKCVSETSDDGNDRIGTANTPLLKVILEMLADPSNNDTFRFAILHAVHEHTAVQRLPEGQAAVNSIKQDEALLSRMKNSGYAGWKEKVLSWLEHTN